MLNEMRLGKITDETVQAFKKLSRKIKYEDSLDATELYVDGAFSFGPVLTVLQLSYKKRSRKLKCF